MEQRICNSETWVMSSRCSHRSRIIQNGDLNGLSIFVYAYAVWAVYKQVPKNETRMHPENKAAFNKFSGGK